MATTLATAIRASIATPLVLTSSFVNATVFDVQQYSALSLACKYTRATGVAGVPSARIEWSSDNSVWFFDPTQDTALTAAAPFASQPTYITDIPLPVPSSDAAISYLLPIVTVPPGAQYMRASFKDAGASPGTLGVEVWPGASR